MVKSKWLLVVMLVGMAIFSAVFGYIFGSTPKNMAVEYTDWSEFGSKMQGYKIYPNPADEKMVDIGTDISENADISRYTVAALQTLSDAESACVGISKKPEKVRITVSSGYMRRMFVFRIGNYTKLLKGEIGTKEFWIDAFDLGVPAESMSSSLGRKSRFEDVFASMDDSAVEITSESMTIKMKGEREDWAGDVAKTCARIYTAQKSTGLYIQTVTITCPTREGTVTVKINYKYFLDMITGKLPAREFQKRVYVERGFQ
jgi:hypothetical protein